MNFKAQHIMKTAAVWHLFAAVAITCAIDAGIDAVAQVTKIGNTLLLDRVTGNPLFPYQLRRAPVSRLPGERTFSHQPVFPLPKPFVRQVFAPSDITDLSPRARGRDTAVA